jgi:hypothetical protein
LFETAALHGAAPSFVVEAGAQSAFSSPIDAMRRRGDGPLTTGTRIGSKVNITNQATAKFKLGHKGLKQASTPKPIRTD